MSLMSSMHGAADGSTYDPTHWPPHAWAQSEARFPGSLPEGTAHHFPALVSHEHPVNIYDDYDGDAADCVHMAETVTGTPVEPNDSNTLHRFISDDFDWDATISPPSEAETPARVPRSDVFMDQNINNGRFHQEAKSSSIPEAFRQNYTFGPPMAFCHDSEPAPELLSPSQAQGHMLPHPQSQMRHVQGCAYT
jgi:hypothetical protein